MSTCLKDLDSQQNIFSVLIRWVTPRDIYSCRLHLSVLRVPSWFAIDRYSSFVQMSAASKTQTGFWPHRCLAGLVPLACRWHKVPGVHPPTGRQACCSLLGSHSFFPRMLFPFFLFIFFFYRVLVLCLMRPAVTARCHRARAHNTEKIFRAIRFVFTKDYLETRMVKVWRKKESWLKIPLVRLSVHSFLSVHVSLETCLSRFLLWVFLSMSLLVSLLLSRYLFVDSYAADKVAILSN